MAPRKFTPVDAARRVFGPPPVLSPARQRIVECAATLWCRDLAFPTVRELAAAAGRAISTVLNGYDELIEVQSTVLAIEWAKLDAATIPGPPLEQVHWMSEHVLELAVVDPDLLRLPSFTVTAMLRADPGRRSSPVAGLVPMLHALAALADVAPSPVSGVSIERTLIRAAGWSLSADRAA